MADPEAPGLVAEMIAEASTHDDVEIADGYRITAIVQKDPEVNTYTIPVQDLDQFFQGYAQTAEIVVDVRPVGGPEE